MTSTSELGPRQPGGRVSTSILRDRGTIEEIRSSLSDPLLMLEPSLYGVRRLAVAEMIRSECLALAHSIPDSYTAQETQQVLFAAKSVYQRALLLAAQAADRIREEALRLEHMIATAQLQLAQTALAKTAYVADVLV